MNKNQSVFIAKSTIRAADLEHRRKINFNIGKYDEQVPLGKKQFADLEKAREMAKAKKLKAILHLDSYLEQFEKNIEARGAKVLWAETADDVKALVLDICKHHNAKMVVKSKSMVTEEVGLNASLAKEGIECVETDLGEYIQQLDEEPPYHIVTPAMHKNKEDIAKLFSEKLGTPKNLSPKELTTVARNILREKFVKAGVGITGANFIIADTGSIAITENEGNARLCSSLPPVHIVIAGIEKVLPSITDLGIFWPLLATFGTGQQVTVYNSIISGPKQPNEPDGPTEMYVILMDNGRTKLIKDNKVRESLACIRCGACLNACPVYKNIGGHAYDTPYTGPIGSVITPHLLGMEGYQHLSSASSLCGRCTEVCPVKINIHGLLLENRHQAADKGLGGNREKLAWKVWKRASLSRGMMNSANSKMKELVVNLIVKGWTTNRSSLKFSEKTFNQMWAEGKHTHIN